MELCLDLQPTSAWARLRERFAGAEVPTDAILTDCDGCTGLCLLLHRVPDERAASEVGFFLEADDATLVEISPGPATTRESLAAAWRIATALGLRPVRLAPGEPSLLARLREGRNRADDPAGRAADLAVLASAALDGGVTGSAEIELLLAELLPDGPDPFEFLNALPATECARQLDRARERCGLAHLPAALRRELRAGTRLAERRVVLEIEGELARVRLVRPRTLNALDPEMLAELEDRWQEAESVGRVRALVLEASGPAFLAGVDLDRILAWMEGGELDRIEDFVRAAHRFLRRVDRCPRTTLVRLHGLAVGAGAEFCAAFDQVVASRQGSVGFPELSLGIYPAMGGTQRLPRRIGLAPARWWILQSALLPAWRAAELGLVDAVVDETQLDAEIRRRAVAPPDRPRAGRKQRADPGPEVAGIAGLGHASLERVLEPGPAATPAALRLAHDLGRRSPVAVRTADTLLQLSRQVDLEAGLEAEIEGLRRVYPTVEALRGIRAALHRTRRSRHR